MAPLKRFSDIINELSMKSDKKLPNLKEPVKGKKGTSKFMRMKIHNAPYTSDYKKAMNAGFKTDANRKAAFAKMNDDVHSADKKPEKYIKPDGKVGIRMVKTDKEIIKKESVGKTAGDKSYYHLQRAKELAKKDGHDYDKLPKYDRAKPHQDHYHDKAKNEASVLKPTKPTDIIKHAKTLAKNPRDYMMNKKKYLDKARAKVFRMYPREEVEEAISRDQMMRMHQQAAASQKKNQAKRDEKEKKSMAAKADMDMRARKESVDEATHDPKHVKQAIGIASDPRYKKGNMTGAVKAMNKISKNIDKHPQVAAVLRRQNEMIDPMDLRGRPKKKDPNPESPYGMKHPLHPANIAKKKAKANVKQSNPDKYEPTFKEAKTFNYFDSKDAASAHAQKHGGKVFVNTGKGATKGKNTHVVIKKEEVEVDEALNLQQRMKRSRLMKRMKSRIKIGRQRAMRKMANKKTIEKRAMRQARNQLAKKLTRGIPKKELTFARKQEIEKRLAKPALQSRIKRIAKRIFKDVRKAEVERKKG